MSESRLAQIVRHRAKLETEGLRLYRPSPMQLPFHLAKSHERLIRGGKRCLAAEQPIYDPVDGRWRRVGDIRTPFHVLSLNAETGALEPKRASAPHVKDVADLYRVKFSDGTELVTTLGHRLLGLDGEWVAVAHAWEHGVRLASPYAFDAPDAPSTPRAASACAVAAGGCDIKAEAASESVLEFAWFLASHPQWMNVGPECRAVTITAVEFERCDEVYDIDVEGFANYWTGVINANSGKSVAAAIEFSSRVLGIPVKGTDGADLPLQFPVSTPEKPLQYWIIGWDTKHAATIHRLLFQRGMGGTMRCIRDEDTGEWRIWNRANPRDAAREAESQLTEPLIPARFWDGDEDEAFSWEEKKQNHWHSCRLANGAIIYYWPSSAKSPKQGEAVAGLWIDEDIQYSGHLQEWQDRLTDMNGWFLWSVWPHTKNNALIDLLDRAANEEGVEDPQIEAFQLIMSQNPFITDEGKEGALARMGDEDEIARRDRGELMLDALAMYDFVPGAHLLKPLEPGEKLPENPTARQKLRHTYSMLGGMPREWTRYLSIDPSNTRTAVQSWVVPPSTYDGVYLGNIAICEWELVAQRYSATTLADALEPRMSGRRYEAFIMDQMIGRQTNTGRDETVFEAYREAFARKGLESRTTHSGFIPGVNIPATRQLAVRDMLSLQEHGLPALLFVAKTTSSTQREFQTYRKKTETDQGVMQILDQPANPRIHDCMAAMEYFAAYIKPQFKIGMAYQDPSVYGAKSSPILARMQKIREQYEQQSGGSYVHLGPGASA